ncbi:hypothetical protein ACFX19_042161 [Malus domestica]
MTNHGVRDLHTNDEIDCVGDQSNGGELENSSASNGVGGSGAGPASRSETGLEERLTGILVDEGDGDLLLQQSNREDRVLQWLEALDMQVMGACRADERLKPLLKMNASNDVAEDRLLAQLSQHFEPAEVGMLARCFCIPLVSIRVGKINKQGTLFCPTAARGNLNLTVLPTSNLRLSFVGDDGRIDRLCTLHNKSQCFAVEINEILADNSGRSFLIKIPDGQILYFWCSETSRLLGIELLSKMKDLLKRKPSIAELTGIGESRLGCFATHLRSYLVGSTVGGSVSSSAGSPSDLDTTTEPSDTAQDGQFSSTSSKSLRSRHGVNQSMRANSSFQGSLSPRSSSFKDLPRTLSFLRNITREKLRRRGNILVSAIDNPTTASPITIDSSCSNHAESDSCPETSRSCSLSSSSFLESLGKLARPPTLNPASQVPYMVTPLLSPYYCWCPPGSLDLQYSPERPELPRSTMESALLPPLSSLLPPNMPSSMLSIKPHLNMADSPLLDFPAFFPDPLVRLPRPTSQQIPTFTPLMCDPIVHIPVIDICSSGQGYLVSAGPTISTGISPLHSKLANIPETDSMLEKGARETLRLLISGSTQNSSQLIDVLPAMLSNAHENRNMLVTGSRGLYSGTRDVDVIANSIAAMGLVSLPGISNMASVLDNSSSRDSFNIQEEGSSGLDGPCSEDKGTAFCSDFRVESTLAQNIAVRCQEQMTCGPGESDEGDRTSAGGGGDSLDLGGGEVRLLLEVLGKIWEGETSDGVGGEAHLTINVIGDRGLEVLARSCKRLRRLRIKRDADEDEDCLVSQRGLTALAQGCLELEYLAVYVSDITNASLEYIGTYSKNLCDFRLFLLDQEETITVLPLDNGVQALLRGGQKLRRFALYLRSGGLTDLGLSYVGQYSQNVRWMLLGYVGESDAGLLEFSKGCPSLQELEMRGCCFSERALADAVMQLTSLRYLWVQGYTVSATGRDLLAMARPFWNIELFPPRRIDVPDQQGEAHPPQYTCILLSPLVRLARPTSQHIPTFTPLMCDPIVHIPVIDICSSGQGYLVSAGPAISTAISSLHSKLANIPETHAGERC